MNNDRRWVRVGGLGLALLLAITLGWDLGPGAIRAVREILAGSRQDVWQQVQTGGKIRLGVDSNDWPFAAVDAHGQYVGLNVDLGRALAERLGVQVEFVPVGYDGAYDALRLGQCDALMGTLENDPARLADFIYTGAYLDAGQVAITRCDALAKCVAPGASDWRGRRVAVELGSEADAAARRIARRAPDVTLVECDSPGQALEAVETGQADVALADAVWARQAVAGRPALRLLPEAVQPYPLALAVRADSARLRTALSRALAELESDGVLEAILARWLDRP